MENTQELINILDALKNKQSYKTQTLGMFFEKIYTENPIEYQKIFIENINVIRPFLTEGFKCKSLAPMVFLLENIYPNPIYNEIKEAYIKYVSESKNFAGFLDVNLINNIVITLKVLNNQVETITLEEKKSLDTSFFYSFLQKKHNLSQFKIVFDLFINELKEKNIINQSNNLFNFFILSKELTNQEFDYSYECINELIENKKLQPSYNTFYSLLKNVMTEQENIQKTKTIFEKTGSFTHDFLNKQESSLQGSNLNFSRTQSYQTIPFAIEQWVKKPNDKNLKEIIFYLFTQNNFFNYNILKKSLNIHIKKAITTNDDELAQKYLDTLIKDDFLEHLLQNNINIGDLFHSSISFIPHDNKLKTNQLKIKAFNILKKYSSILNIKNNLNILHTACLHPTALNYLINIGFTSQEIKEVDTPITSENKVYLSQYKDKNDFKNGDFPLFLLANSINNNFSQESNIKKILPLLQGYNYINKQNHSSAFINALTNHNENTNFLNHLHSHPQFDINKESPLLTKQIKKITNFNNFEFLLKIIPYNDLNIKNILKSDLVLKINEQHLQQLINFKFKNKDNILHHLIKTSQFLNIQMFLEKNSELLFEKNIDNITPFDHFLENQYFFNKTHSSKKINLEIKNIFSLIVESLYQQNNNRVEFIEKFDTRLNKLKEDSFSFFSYADIENKIQKNTNVLLEIKLKNTQKNKKINI